MATLDVTQKTEVYETLSSLNMAFAGIVQHLQTLQKTGLCKSRTAKLFPSFTLELQAEFNQEFLENLHQLELDDWGVTGKLDNAGKRKLVTLTTFSFRPKNAQSSLPNNAREQPSRKSCKIAMHSPYHVKGHLLGALFLCIVKGASGNHETTSELH
jgi:hypothetical protein